MSKKTKEDIFVVKNIKLYGLYRDPLYNEEHLYYFQNLFVRGEEVKENFVGIKICDKDGSSDPTSGNSDFMVHMLKLVDIKALPCYDKTESYDSEKFMLHGADAKVLIFCGEIVAIGNSNEEYWIPTENFFKGFEANNFNKLKKELVENRICECEKEIKNYLISGSTNYEKYSYNIRLLNNLNKII